MSKKECRCYDRGLGARWLVFNPDKAGTECQWCGKTIPGGPASVCLTLEDIEQAIEQISKESGMGPIIDIIPSSEWKDDQEDES